MKNFKCLIVEDDSVDALMVQSMVKNYDEFVLEKVFHDAASAFVYLEKNQIDILFLDIDMPEMSGIELRKKLHNIPITVFISSHTEYAIDTYEFDTLDFIVKPVRKEKFEKTAQRIFEYFETQRKAELFQDYLSDNAIFIKEGHREIKVNISDVLYLEALKDYTKIITENNRHIVLSSIGNLLKDNNFKDFIRIHKSFAVQPKFIQKKSANELVLHNGIRLAIGRKYKNLI